MLLSSRSTWSAQALMPLRPRPHCTATAPCTLQVLQDAPPPRVRTSITPTVAATRATLHAAFKWMQLSVVCHVNRCVTQMTLSCCCTVALVIVRDAADCIEDEAAGPRSTRSPLVESEDAMVSVDGTRTLSWSSLGSVRKRNTAHPADINP